MSVQLALFDEPEVVITSDTDVCAELDTKSRGAVFTKSAVVDFMLDLAGYTEDKDLWTSRVLEPACGKGSFLIAAAGRLLRSWGRSGLDDRVLDGAIRAVELDQDTVTETRHVLTELLISRGLPQFSAARVTKAWLTNADFLTSTIEDQFDVIIGNPPYVRQENVSSRHLAAYRQSFSTMVGRADMYVAFFERALSLLRPGGQLCFICADAWTRNDYGRELRKLITLRFALRAYIDMYGLDAFETSVGAYPSITLIERGPRGAVSTAKASSLEPAHLSSLVNTLRNGTGDICVLPELTVGSGPWLLRGGSRQEAVRQLESQCLTLEQAGGRVGIGVATGADKAFIAPYESIPVEEDRKLPLAINKDITDGRLSWHGMGVINPWSEAGGLVSLTDYPRLAAYLEPHRRRLSGRHTAKSDPASRWYKTIDRIIPELTWQPKLLVPDIRGDGDAIAYDNGTLYPHHNLYYITSQTWDLRALQALLRSGLARLFVDAYAVKIGGGYLRFQAQYLRRIRIPSWSGLTQAQQDELTNTGIEGAKLSPSSVEKVCGLDAGSLSFMEEWL